MLAPRMRQLATEALALEDRSRKQMNMLDSVFDLHNDLVDWATNTEYLDAADEVLQILEKYIKRSNANKRTGPRAIGRLASGLISND